MPKQALHVQDGQVFASQSFNCLLEQSEAVPMKSVGSWRSLRNMFPTWQSGESHAVTYTHTQALRLRFNLHKMRYLREPIFKMHFHIPTSNIPCRKSCPHQSHLHFPRHLSAETIDATTWQSRTTPHILNPRTHILPLHPHTPMTSTPRKTQLQDSGTR